MKKVMLFILFISFVAFEANAQVTGGLKGGINLSNQKWEISFMGESASEKFEGTGFHIGGYLTYALSDVVTLQPELMFNALKVDLDGENTSLNYISVPVMLGYGFESNKLILQAGPQIGILLSTDPSELKQEDAYKGIDFSFNMGAQVNLNKFNLSIRYGLGLTNLTGDALEEELEAFFGEDIDLKIKNNNLQLSVGYKLFGE